MSSNINTKLKQVNREEIVEFAYLHLFEMKATSAVSLLMRNIYGSEGNNPFSKRELLNSVTFETRNSLDGKLKRYESDKCSFSHLFLYEMNHYVHGYTIP